MRRGHRERRRARICTSLSSRQEPAAGAKSERERRVRDALRGTSRRPGDDVSGVHQKNAAVSEAEREEKRPGGAWTVRNSRGKGEGGRWKKLAGCRLQVLLAVAVFAVFASVPRV